MNRRSFFKTILCISATPFVETNKVEGLFGKLFRKKPETVAVYMVHPIREAINYQRVARKLLPVEPIESSAPIWYFGDPISGAISNNVSEVNVSPRIKILPDIVAAIDEWKFADVKSRRG